MFLYLITVKCNSSRYVSLESFKKSLALIRENFGCSVEFHDHEAYELDTRNRLHTHQLARTPNIISYSKVSKKLSELTGLHVHIKPIKINDYENAYKYVTKEAYTKEYLDELSKDHYMMLNTPKLFA